jgi:ABC-type glycerol-3-phosphate transport system substrate-binding protein
MGIAGRIVRTLPLIFLSAGALLLSGCGKQAPPAYRVDLEVWGLFDDSDSYQEAFNAYQQVAGTHLSSVEYRKMTPETYRDDLLNAFAEGNGPDVFLIRSSWLPLFRNLIVPAPSYQVTEKEFRDAFVDVVADDLVVDGEIYGAPLSVDSLALYYNKSLFNAAGITSPPSTWDELIADSVILNSLDENGRFDRSAISLGTARNINRSTDILLALATQYGLAFGNDGFSDSVSVSSEPMRQALSFYSGFSEIGSGRYSWNPDQHYSVDAFYEGNLAMMINYSWQIDAIRRKNGKLDFGTAPLPRLTEGESSNYANYWMFVVAKNKSAPNVGGQQSAFPADRYSDIRIHESWQFLKYLTFPHLDGKIVLRNALDLTSMAEAPISVDPAKSFLLKTGQPAARRDLVEFQKADPFLAPFATGNLVARDWRVGETEQVEEILADTIESVNRGERTVESALSSAESRIIPIQRKVSEN